MKLSKRDIKAFEGDTEWQGQKDAEDFSSAPPGFYAYEPYKEADGTEQTPNMSDIKKFVNEMRSKMPTRMTLLNAIRKKFPNATHGQIINILRDELAVAKESDFGFFDGPVDQGKHHDGDFPSVSWMPS